MNPQWVIFLGPLPVVFLTQETCVFVVGFEVRFHAISIAKYPHIPKVQLKLSSIISGSRKLLLFSAT